MTSAKEIKRYLSPGDMLVLAELDGAMWASNRYWLTRASHLAAFLDKQGIEGPGVWDVNGRVTRRENAGSCSDLFARFLNIADYTVPLGPVTIGDHEQVYTLGPDGYCELLHAPDGRHIAVRADWLNWLEEAPVPTANGPIYEMQLVTTERPTGPIAIIAAPLDDDTAEPQLAAVVMPVLKRCSDGEDMAWPAVPNDISRSHDGGSED